MAAVNGAGDGIFSATYNGVSPTFALDCFPLCTLLHVPFPPPPPPSLDGLSHPCSGQFPLTCPTLKNPVWEFQFVGPDAKREHVMRRQSDNWVNATHILKAAGFDKPARTRILERDVQKGNHEKVQGGYGKFQGTKSPAANSVAVTLRSLRRQAG